MLELRQLAEAVGATLERRESADVAWNRVADLARWLQPKYRDVTVLKAALPLVATEEFLSRAQQEAESEKLPLATFAQLGVGIVHLCASQEILSPNLAAWISRLRKAATDLKGTLVIEQCAAELKSQVDVWGAQGDDLGAMRKLKTAWDPQAVLSPGRFVDGI